MQRIAALVLSLAGAALPLRGGSSGIGAIGTYAGTWATHTTHYKTIYSKPRTEAATLRNVCWRSAGYFACDQFVNGFSKALIVFTYDRAHNIYRTYTVPTNGGAAGSGTLMISGNTWIYPWQQRDGTRKVYLRVVNTFLNANTIAYRQEFSYDKAHWTVTSSGTERRTVLRYPKGA